MFRKTHTAAIFLCLPFSCISALHAQNGSCVEALRQAWGLEREFEQTYLSRTPATDARKLSPKAEAIGSRLLFCQPTEEEKSNPVIMQALTAERLNLEFISTVELYYAGLKLGPDIKFHEDLGDLAPACKEVLASELPQRIEKFADQHRESSGLKTKDVSPYYSEANPRVGAGLTICASEADRVGYKDVAIRLLTDALLLENLAHLAALNEQAALIKVVESAPSGVVPVQVGPRHCTATLRNWGWEKTLAWDCY